MPLPKIDSPIFELKLVSLPNPVKFRPFLVKEEKLLLMALQGEDEDNIYKTIKQVINNCLISDIDIDTLPIFDIEYMFLNVRARSMGESIESYFMCRNVVGKDKDENGEQIDVECKNLMPISINILDIKPPVTDVQSKVYVTDKIGIQLKFPNLRSFRSIEMLSNELTNEKLFELIYECTDYVFDENGVYYASESSKEEVLQFIDALTQEQFDRIVGFFESLPKIKHDTTTTCQKCGFKHDLHLEGLNDFFI